MFTNIADAAVCLRFSTSGRFPFVSHNSHASDLVQFVAALPLALTIDGLDVGDIFPKLALEIFVIKVLWRGVAIGAGLAVILLHSHRLLLHVELLIEALFTSNKLQYWIFYDNVNIV